MSIERMMTKDATILRRVESGKKDRYGNALVETVEDDVRCAFQQRDRSESEDGGELSKARWNLWLPYGTELDTGDAVRVNGRVYEVEGEPGIFDEGSPSMWHVTAIVKRVAGTASKS